MKKLVAFVAVAAVTCLLSTRANAVLVGANLTATPSSTLTITIAIEGLGAGGGTLDVTGTSAVTLDNEAGPVAEGIRIDDMEIGLSDETFDINLTLVQLTASTVGVGASGMGPLVSATPIGGGMSIADLAGTTLSLDEGMITYAATAGLFSTALPPGSFDFEADPLPVVLPSGSTVKISEALIGTDTAVTVFIPLAVTETIDTEAIGIPILAILGGAITFTGFKSAPVIPEPGTWILIGLGLTGLIPLIRRRLKK